MNADASNCVRVAQIHPTWGGGVNSVALTITKTPLSCSSNSWNCRGTVATIISVRSGDVWPSMLLLKGHWISSHPRHAHIYYHNIDLRISLPTTTCVIAEGVLHCMRSINNFRVVAVNIVFFQPWYLVVAVTLILHPLGCGADVVKESSVLQMMSYWYIRSHTSISYS